MKGYVYACLFSTGAVKVGRSTLAGKRMDDHRRAGLAFGAEVVSQLEMESIDCVAAERQALAEVGTLADRRVGHEWFFGVGFDVVCDAVRRAVAGASIAQPERMACDEPRRVRFVHDYPATWLCRACRTPIPALREFGDAFLCAACFMEGYRAAVVKCTLDLRLNGEAVPLWSRSPDANWPVINRPHPGGRPCIDVAAPVAQEAEHAA